MTPLLENFYWTMVLHHSASGFVSRIPLLVVLYLVATGNQQPGRRFLTGVLAAHFFLCWMMSVGVGGQITLVSLMSLALFGSCAWIAWSEETPWRILPKNPALSILVTLGLALAFIWPFWKYLSWWAGPFFSPMGVLPHQTLVVLLILLAMTGRESPRLLVIVGAASALVLAAIDMIYAGKWTTSFIAVLGLVALGLHFIAPHAKAPAEDGDDEGEKKAPATTDRKQVEDPPGEERKEKKAAGKKWDVR